MNAYQQEMRDLQVKRVNIFRDQGDTRNRIARRRTWHLWAMTLLIAGSILWGSAMVSVALGGYCPEDEGIEFLSTRSG